MGLEEPDARPMMRRRCLLHIGLCKTGTTSVQHVLAANRALLLQHGCYVPRSLVPSSFGPTSNHRRLPLLALEQAGEAGAWEWQVMRHRDPGLRGCRDLAQAQALVEWELMAELESCPPQDWVVFSSEQLSQRLLHDGDVERLRGVLDRLGFAEVRVLVYLREQVGLALSWESMEVLAGKATPMDPEPGERFDHRLLLERWERVFGRGAIRARTYARRCLQQGDIVRDFLEVGLGLPQALPLQQRQQWRNGRLGERGLRLLRWVNRRLPALAAPGPNPRRLRLVRWLSHPWLGGRPQQASPELVARFAACYAASNQWVDDRYGTHLGDTFAAT